MTAVVTKRGRNYKPKRGEPRAKDHPIYEIWCGIKARCYNASHRSYPIYGGRGIAMCERWQEDFWAFVADMGERPTGASVDRIDSNAGYSPENCHWADVKQQNRNQRDNVRLTIDGVAKCQNEWAEATGLHRNVIARRVAAGLVGAALIAPVRAPGRLIGVRQSRGGRFIACVKTKGRSASVGTFDSAEEAGRAYDVAALKLFGVRAKLNFLAKTEETTK